MKIAFINDTHFGVRNDSPFFIEHILKFLETKFIPYLIDNNIDTVIHLGDFFDRRKYVNFNTLSMVRKRFIEPLSNNNIKIYLALGNHDTYYKNTNEINSIKELFNNRENFILIDSPQEIKFDDVCVSIVPWITQENYSSSLNFIQNSTCRVMCGHFEIVGFQVMSGVKHTHGLTINDFNKFEMVLSGHFHLKQQDKNIYYLGSQYQMNFGDVNSKKGFHVLDTETMELTFVENENNIFHIFNYDDSDENEIKNIAKFISKSDLRGSFVRVFIRQKTKQVIFDKFLDALWEKNIQDVSIVDEMNLNLNNSSVAFDESQDTLSIINNEIDMIERDIDKLKLKNIIKDLYMESLSL